MKKSELLKSVGYSDEFINSLKEYEDLSKKQISLNPITERPIHIKSFDLSEFDFSKREFEDTTSTVVYI